MAYEAQYQRDSAGDYGTLVASASPEARARFITRTYLHLVAAILVFAGLELLWFVTPVAQMLVSAFSMGRFAMLLFMAAFIGVSMLAQSWASNEGSPAKQYLGLGLYTVFESVLFVPLIAFALALGAEPGGDTNILPRAIMITLTLFGGLTGVVFITRKDFSFMRSVLMFGSFAALGLMLVSLLFGYSLGMFFSYAMVTLACGYILYDTSNVMRAYRTTQHVAAALALFASVMLLFWYVLRILIDRRR
jgi:FtsH-binding integral membrane protein